MLYPKLQPTPDGKYIVLEDYTINGITVPKGYQTNGADIPRMFWLVVSPFKPKYLPAVIIHDYLCDTGTYTIADKAFEEILLEIENSLITRGMIFIVKQYHRFECKYLYPTHFTCEDRN